ALLPSSAGFGAGSGDAATTGAGKRRGSTPPSGPPPRSASLVRTSATRFGSAPASCSRFTSAAYADRNRSRNARLPSAFGSCPSSTATASADLLAVSRSLASAIACCTARVRSIGPGSAAWRAGRARAHTSAAGRNRAIGGILARGRPGEVSRGRGRPVLGRPRPVGRRYKAAAGNLQAEESGRIDWYRPAGRAEFRVVRPV